MSPSEPEGETSFLTLKAGQVNPDNHLRGSIYSCDPISEATCKQAYLQPEGETPFVPLKAGQVNPDNHHIDRPQTRSGFPTLN